ncbi:hypothetical protein ACFL5F_00190 [Planctomycetota bacterium]
MLAISEFAGCGFDIVSTDSLKMLVHKFAYIELLESVSLVSKDENVEMLLSVSYDNKDLYSASKQAQEFGSILTRNLK